MRPKGWFPSLVTVFLLAVSCQVRTPPATILPPSSAVSPARSPTPVILTPIPSPGAISGHLSYPSDFIPELRVVAFVAGDSSRYYYIDTVQNQTSYRIAEVPAGRYDVVAYMLDPANTLAGGYTQAVRCGLRVDCQDHALLEVIVISGQEIMNIDPGDWYAPAGTFPPRP